MKKVTLSCHTMKGEALKALSGKWLLMIVSTIIYAVLPSFLILIGNGIMNSVNSVSPIFTDSEYRIFFSYGMVQYDQFADVKALEELAFKIFAVGLCIYVLLAGPLQMGISKMNLDLSRGMGTKFKELFISFRNSKLFFKSIGLQLFISFFIMLWTTPIIVLGIYLAANLFLFDPSAMFLFIIIWTLLGVIPGIIAYIRYSMAYYIMLDDPNISIRNSVKLSKSMMSENIGKYFVLNLSFIGWYFLVICICGFVLFTLIRSDVSDYMGMGEYIKDIISLKSIMGIVLGNIAIIAVSSIVDVYRRMSLTVFYNEAKGESMAVDHKQQLEDWHNVGLVNQQEQKKEEKIEKSEVEKPKEENSGLEKSKEENSETEKLVVEKSQELGSTITPEEVSKVEEQVIEEANVSRSRIGLNVQKVEFLSKEEEVDLDIKEAEADVDNSEK